jgi:3-hydroxyacyl-[acyl-carrier protein] dehydratase/trans-2-decenoyl-[acyl-carrier protein] isomerase
MTFIPTSSYTKDDLVACGNGDLFGPNNGRLPADEMLMFDSIDQIDKTSGQILQRKNYCQSKYQKSLWFFKVHFKSDPVMPGCLGLDAMWQLLGFYLCWLELPGYGRALGSDKVKFFGQVTPSAEIVRYEIDIKRVVNRGAVVGFADGNMFVDDRHVYSADGLRVGLFKDTSEF